MEAFYGHKRTYHYIFFAKSTFRSTLTPRWRPIIFNFPAKNVLLWPKLVLKFKFSAKSRLIFREKQAKKRHFQRNPGLFFGQNRSNSAIWRSKLVLKFNFSAKSRLVFQKKYRKKGLFSEKILPPFQKKSQKRSKNQSTFEKPSFFCEKQT